MASKVLVVSEVMLDKDKSKIVASKWNSQQPPEDIAERKLYVSLDENSVLELMAISDFSHISKFTCYWNRCRDSLGKDISGDIRRQVLEYIEAPKNIESSLPESAFVQMRHIEVKLLVYNDYLAWRSNTIFKIVRQTDEIESFLAYHSILSTEPGVMFIVGFSCDVDVYLSVFNSLEYKEIIKEAGQQFIAGGQSGLYTRIYRQISMQRGI